MKLLDRYVLRNFVQPYLYCIVGFVSIWLIYDVSDNVSVFIEQNFGPWRTAQYYLTQLPQIGVILLPISLLLALLYSLGRMSRANEIVSMLTAGISVPRVLLPLIFVGFLTVWATYALNYELAPHSETARRNLLMSERVRRESRIEGQIFRNRTDNRTWFIQSFRKGENRFHNVQVLQQNEHDKIITNYIAAGATFEPATKTWTLQGVKIVNYDDQGNITHEEMQPSLVVNNWSETPYRLGSANVRAENLSVPELRDYLRYNSDFPRTLLAPFHTHLQYRLALPWTCMVVVLIAAPLGIGYSRRGILSSVAASIILVFAMQFLTHLFIALGEGDRVPAWIAGWMPNLIFTVIGAYLLFLRATNREGFGLQLFGVLFRK
ncbi:MAG TPA: LptF/LptG family permease [Chthoniobacterales bacterium]|nr:LptF/LptG family permease [Chthoniobacterales bacterium]